MDSHQHLSQVTGVTWGAPQAQTEKNNKPSAWDLLWQMVLGNPQPSSCLHFLTFSEILGAHRKSQTSRRHPHTVPCSELVLCTHTFVGKEVGKGTQLHPSGLCRDGQPSLAVRAASGGLSSCWKMIITWTGFNFTQVLGISAHNSKSWVNPSFSRGWVRSACSWWADLQTHEVIYASLYLALDVSSGEKCLVLESLFKTRECRKAAEEENCK